MYRQYRFVEIATADYRFPEVEFIVDVYRFADDAGAYGLYAAVRPDEPDLLAIGTQGFCTESTVTAVKGRYLARLIAFDESSQTGAMLAVAADSLMRRLPGSTDRPAAFARFPDSARVPCGDRYYPASYLGQAFLTDVYEQAYALGPDTVRLFFAADSSGGKFLRWQEAAGAEKVQTDLPFDGGAALMIRSYADTAAAGLRQFTLAGMRAYAPRHRDFFARWLAALGG
ncbi:MAG: hypothetical protein QUT27_07570 [candidate division Zixibacteria bacterium]|nr:hypothetical protein [candidate division Zixibacteria bacterium]